MTLQSTVPTRVITLVDALQMATNNLTALSAQQVLDTAKADVKAADHAPLPTVSSGISNIDLQNGVGAGSWLNQKRVDRYVGIDWTWERGNKRWLRTQAATSSLVAAEHDKKEVLIQQRMQAALAFFDLRAAQSRLEQIEAITSSSIRLSEVARQRLQAGDLSAQDASRTMIDAERAKSDLLAAKQELANARYALSLVLSLGPSSAQDQDVRALQAKLNHAPDPLQPYPSLQVLWQATNANTNAAGGLATALASLVDTRADIHAAQARVDAAQAQLQGALALQKKDLTIGVQADNFPGTSDRMLWLRLQMPLQWGYAYEGEIARAKAQLLSAELALEKTRRDAQIDLLRSAQALGSSIERAVSATQTIAPAARRVAEQAELAYGKGAIPLTDLLEARRIWRATTLDAIGAQTDFEKALTFFALRYDQPELLPN